MGFRWPTAQDSDSIGLGWGLAILIFNRHPGWFWISGCLWTILQSWGIRLHWVWGTWVRITDEVTPDAYSLKTLPGNSDTFSDHANPVCGPLILKLIISLSSFTCNLLAATWWIPVSGDRCTGPQRCPTTISESLFPRNSGNSVTHHVLLTPKDRLLPPRKAPAVTSYCIPINAFFSQPSSFEITVSHELLELTFLAKMNLRNRFMLPMKAMPFVPYGSLFPQA